MSGDGMSDFVQALINPSTGSGITSGALWTEATQAAPLIIAIFTFAFGFYIVRRVLKGGAKGKLKV